jgi:hypothetical protein
MTLTKKVTIGIISFLSFLLLVNFGVNYWIQKQLPKIILQNNKTPYHISYKKLQVDLFSSTIYASNVVIVPKRVLKKSDTKIGIYSKIESIKITNYKLWSFLFDDVIKAESITIKQPNVTLYKKDTKAINNANSIRTEVLDPFQKIIIVSNIYLQKGTLAIISTRTNKPILSTQNISTVIEGILVDDKTLKNKIPFLYHKYVFNCDSLYYKPNEFYRIRAVKIRTTNHTLQINKFEYLPEYSRTQFVQKIPKEKDLFTITGTSIAVNNMDWGFKNNVFFFNANSISLDNVNANIYRNKLPKDDLTKKHLYNTLLRKIPFPMKVDTLLIRNSKLVYEEEIDFEKGPSILTFDRFNLKANHIRSGYGLKKATDLDIKINCLFMKNSPLKIHWTLKILDPKDGFRIKGNIQNFDVHALSKFTRPYINTSFTGVFKTFDFDIIGNDKKSSGNAWLAYKDLKVTFYKKNDPNKEAKIKNVLANLIVKKDSDGKAKKATIELERIPEKSFYNFLWRNIAEFLKEILI